MKAQLETIHYSKNRSSFHFFNRKERQFHSYRHFHPELELTYIDQGKGIRFVGDNIFSYQPGDLVLIGENLPHDYVSTSMEEGHDSSAFVFQFPSSLIQNSAECMTLQSLFAEANYGIHFINPSDELIQKIKSVSSNPTLKNYILFLDILSDLRCFENKQTISSISFNEKYHSRNGQGKISSVTRYISENFDQPLTVGEMAKYTHMTSQSFCRWFKQSVGSSFVTYLNRIRIENACQLLLETNDSVSRIGLHSGFETVGHFNRTFKKVKGMTPKGYRKMSI